MHDHFVSSVFCICPKTPLSIFTSQNISQISRDFICSPLSNRGWTEEISSDIHQNIQNYYFNTHNFNFFQKNIIISKSATIYHCSSTMAHGIGQDHKPEKKTRSDSTIPHILLQHLESLVTGPRRGVPGGASFLLLDWQVRVFWSSGIVDRPSGRMYIRNFPLSGCMDRCYHHIPFYSQ